MYIDTCALQVDYIDYIDYIDLRLLTQVVPSCRCCSNRRFPNSLQPPFQIEAKCEVFVMKISFYSY